jgi:uncharacterized protein (TIGR03437 family)
MYPVPLAVALNEDGTPNSESNPAKAGSTVTILATGFGPVTPTAVDGQSGSAVPLSPAACHPNAPAPAGPLPFLAGPAPTVNPVWTNFIYLTH